MSPESLLHQKYSTYSDVWSIGALMVEMVVRDTPWNLISNMEAIQVVGYEGKTPPVPEDTHPVLLKAIQVSFILNLIFTFKMCMRTDPKERIGTAELIAYFNQ